TSGPSGTSFSSNTLLPHYPTAYRPIGEYLMKDIISFLLKVSPRIVVLAIVASVLAGVTNTLLLAVISSALSGGNGRVSSFAVLVVAMLICRVAAMLLLTRLTLSYTLGLRMTL